MRHFSYSFLLCLLLALPACRDVDAEYSSRMPRRGATIQVQVDGQSYPYEVRSLTGEDTTIAPGDVADIGVLDESMLQGFSLVSGRQDDCGLYVNWRVHDHQTLRPHNLSSSVETDAEDANHFLDPFHGLSDAEISGLHAVGIRGWSPDFCRRLQFIDPERCLITADVSAQYLVDATLLTLPSTLQYLHASFVHPSYLSPGGPWSSVTSLRFLEISSGLKLDAAWIARQKDLLYLDGSINRYWSNLHLLSTLSNLRVLKLHTRSDISDIEFVRSMAELRVLDISQTMVTDLSPIGALPNIRTVLADGAPIAHLPAGHMPSLRVLTLQSTKVTDDDLLKFSRNNPNCQIARRWHKTLADTVAGATRLRVARPRQVPTAEGYFETLFNESDPDAIHRFVKSLYIDEPQPGITYLCTTTHFLEFYQEDSLLASVDMICASDDIILRWRNYWPGDVKLSGRGAATIHALFKQRGFQLADD